MFIAANYPLPVPASVRVPATLGCAGPAARARVPLSGFVRANYLLPAGGAAIRLPQTLGCACQQGGAPARRTVKGLGFSWRQALIGAGAGFGTDALAQIVSGGGNNGNPAQKLPQFNPSAPGATFTPSPMPTMVPTTYTQQLTTQPNPRNPPHQLISGVNNDVLIGGGVAFAALMAYMMGKKR